MGLERSGHYPALKTDPSFVHTIEGRELRYADLGPPDGPILLLLHGYTDSGLSFSRLIEHLPPRLRLIIPDQRGHGGSTKTAARHGRRDFAADAVALLDGLGIAQPVVVVGHSLGTLTAQRIAADHPERVAGLVLIGAAAGASANPALQELWLALEGLAEAPDRAFIRDFQSSTAAMPLPEDFLAAVIEESAQLPLTVWRQALADLLDGEQDAPLSAIMAPTLILWGEEDGVFSAQDQQILQDGLANAELRRYARTGHAPHWEKPQQVAQDVEIFLRHKISKHGWL